MDHFLASIINPQISFEGERQDEKFIKLFCNLYRIELFKDGLDLILTKLQQQKLRFEIRYIKGWDTNVGCFLTEPQNFSDRLANKFLTNRNLKIILRSLNYNVLAHEMAHALEYESKINLGETFRQAIALDMKDRKANLISLESQIQRLMVDALKSYKPNQFISELFARYFELLSISRNVIDNGDFTTDQVMDFFVNTTKFIKEIFNPNLKKIIDPKIASYSDQIAFEVKIIKPQLNFQDRIESRNTKTSGSWAKGIKSNASYQESWNKMQKIESDKK
jgi:hypothetical protein